MLEKGRKSLRSMREKFEPTKGRRQEKSDDACLSAQLIVKTAVKKAVARNTLGKVSAHSNPARSMVFEETP